MKIGYPCINRSVGCTANSTFRLANYSEENLITKVANNLTCLENILRYNIRHELLFFRISSDLIPFASHPVCRFNWKIHFKKRIQYLGRLIKDNDIRISMHPDQFVLINAQKAAIVKNSLAELAWHCELLDLMKLDYSAKVQIHIGGVYGDKASALQRFIENFKKASGIIKNRLAVENDDRLFSLKDCLYISEKSGIPVIFDCFHHSCLNNKETMAKAIELAAATWKRQDGILMADYSSQQPNSKIGKHTDSIDMDHFTEFINSTKSSNFDIMLEIKDKEKSALKALKIVKEVRDN